jgi:dTDP-4-dehydrorhamnose 3,5-epimerase
VTVTPTSIPEVVLLEPKVHGDARGYLFEAFSQRTLDAALGRSVRFVQDNQSHSSRGVLRGLHYQCPHPQGKLVRVLQGRIFDVAVDARRDSPTFGRWVGEELSSENKRQLWVPEGFAHGFVVLSETADVLYKITDFWHPQDEQCILWNDPALGIRWPLGEIKPQVAAKDLAGRPFANARHFEPGDLPR